MVTLPSGVEAEAPLFGGRGGPVRVPSGTAPGIRDCGYYKQLGALGGVGFGGSSWSSAINDTSGVNLDFNSQALNPSNVSFRAYSFQLRCLSE